MKEAFVGIDVAFAKGKVLPISICTWEKERLVPLPLRTLSARPPRGRGNAATLDDALVEGFALDAADYVLELCQAASLELVRVGIDAPSRPKRDGASSRTSEAALASARISCFATPSASEFEAIRDKVRRHLENGGAENALPHANQLWMLPGFALFREFEKYTECIEVYPQATVQAIGAAGVKKTEPGGVDKLLKAASSHTGWPGDSATETRFADLAFGPAHDRLDAYLSAWVAALDADRRVAYGQPPHDAIWVPRVRARSSDPAHHSPTGSRNASFDFDVRLELDGGFCASAHGGAIVTQADTLQELRKNVREAVRAFLADEVVTPKIRLRVHHDEVL